jgi:hypothetical protein
LASLWRQLLSFLWILYRLALSSYSS